MSYRIEDEQKLLDEFIEWLFRENPGAMDEPMKKGWLKTLAGEFIAERRIK